MPYNLRLCAVALRLTDAVGVPHAGYRLAYQVTEAETAWAIERLRAIDPAEGRLRAFAAGEMARSLPGELAMFDPPARAEAARFPV